MNFEIGQANVITPAGVDHNRMGAFVVAAIDQQQARATAFPQGSFLFTLHRINSAMNQNQCELAIPGVTCVAGARRMSCGTVVPRAHSLST